jgi:hypothetical protein
VQFLDLVRTKPDARIFVHSEGGKDRTGVMIASRRIGVEHESVVDAVSEMHRYHYDWLRISNVTSSLYPNGCRATRSLRTIAPRPNPLIDLGLTPAKSGSNGRQHSLEYMSVVRNA